MKIIDADNLELSNVALLMEQTSENIFLTGKAGTGKSTFIREYSQTTRKKHVILAPTGLAALNINGQTIHSFFKLPLRPFLPGDPNLKTEVIHKIRKNQKKLISELELIIIDEVSMVRADLIDAIDSILRSIRRRNYLPFGGVQILFVGDLFQIEPVVKADEQRILGNFYPSLFFFNAFVFEQFPLVSIELHKVYRQNDAHFIAILDKIRVGQVSNEDLQAINKQVLPPEKGETNAEKDLAVVLATTRDRVNRINSERLQTLSSEEVNLIGQIEGTFPESNLPTEMELVLKEGAQIIFTANDVSQKRWVNGTLGILTQIDVENNVLEVALESGEIVEVKPYTWNNKRYFLNEKKNKIEEDILGSFTQFPIKLAWAITIHKSQGLTFEHAEIDLRSGVFAKGQTYVALSRCRSLEGIRLYAPLSHSDLSINKVVEKFYQTTNNPEQIQESITKAKALGHVVKASKLWDSKHTSEAIDEFCLAITAQPNLLTLERNIRFLKHKVSYMLQEVKEVQTLKKEILAEKKKLRGLAQEYLKMAQMTPPFIDQNIALRNCEKALSLYPQYTDAWIEKSLILFRIDKSKEATTALKKALETSPVNKDVLWRVAEIYSRNQQGKLAIKTLLKLLSITPKNKEALHLLIRLYEEIGQDDIADEFRNRLLS